MFSAIDPRIIIGLMAGIPALIGVILILVSTGIKISCWKSQSASTNSENNNIKSNIAGDILDGVGTTLVVVAFCGAVLAFSLL